MQSDATVTAVPLINCWSTFSILQSKMVAGWRGQQWSYMMMWQRRKEGPQSHMESCGFCRVAGLSFSWTGDHSGTMSLPSHLRSQDSTRCCNSWFKLFILTFTSSPKMNSILYQGLCYFTRTLSSLRHNLEVLYVPCTGPGDAELLTWVPQTTCICSYATPAIVPSPQLQSSCRASVFTTLVQRSFSISI